MHPLYAKSTEVVDQLREARLAVARLAAELSQAEYALRVDQARVERGWIKKVGGEKALAPTSEDRARIYVLALDADPDYKAALARRDDLERELAVAKVEAQALTDRLNVMVAAMQGESAGAA
jgi:hypothetical protein